MAVQKIESSTSDLIIRDNWPDHDEEGYGDHIDSQVDAAFQAKAGRDASSGMARAVDDNMTGQTADAAKETHNARAEQLEKHGDKHDANATILALIAENTARTKTNMNGEVNLWEKEWKRYQVRAVTEGYTQQEMQDAHDELIKEFQGRVDTLKANHDSTHQSLIDQLNSGNVSVPDTFPGGSSDGAPAPKLDYHAEVQSRVGKLI